MDSAPDDGPKAAATEADGAIAVGSLPAEGAAETSDAVPDPKGWDGGIAVIKPEFIVTAPTPAEDVVSSSSDTKTRFKKRPRDEDRPISERMCVGTVVGSGCPFGPSCRYAHDMVAFMAEREPDLGPRCVNYDLYGVCRMGALCRFGSCHIDSVTGANKERPETDGGLVAPPEETNTLSKETQALLRKNKFPFVTPRAGFNAGEDKKAGARGGGAAEPEAPTAATAASAATMSLDPLPRPVKLVDFSNKIYVAPLTTVGNLPFRRIMKHFGADITCGEMAMCSNLLSGQVSEWSLLRRHPSEDIFGVQIAAAHPDQFMRTAELLESTIDVDFVDVNCGCPIDLVCDKGAGSALMTRPKKILGMVEGLTKFLTCPITIKMRIGWNENKPNAHSIIKAVEDLPTTTTERISAFMIHGRSRLQRYSRNANWDYIHKAATGRCAAEVPPPKIPVIGNGDIYTFEEWEQHKAMGGMSSCCMLARGAIIKPWLPTELKESRHWDISSTERLDILKKFTSFGLEHWGSDQKGVNNVRRFILEWLSFLHRYIPVGILEHMPVRMNDKHPHFCGRNDLETLMASTNAQDWVKISELLLGPVPDGFKFLPKHKSNAYSAPSSGKQEAEG